MIINGQTINDPLAQVQTDTLNLLLGNPALGWTFIYTYKDFVVKAVADQNLSVWKDVSGGLGKHGTAIEVRMPAIIPQYPNVPGPQQLLELTVRVMEDGAQNNTGVTCESLAWEIQAWLDGQSIEAFGVGGLVLYPKPSGNSINPVYEYPDRFAYDVVMIAQWPQDARVRCPQPLITDDGAGQVTLNDTSGIAQVYYTLDGSLPIIPVPGKAAVAPCQFYQAPFAVGEGTQITWLAWRAGALPSFIGRAIIHLN